MIFDLLCIPLNFLEANSNESTWITYTWINMLYIITKSSNHLLRALLECYSWQSIRMYLPNHSIATAQELKACAMACAFLGNNTLEPLWSWESISWHVYCMEICMQRINGVGPHILIAYDCITKHISIWYGSSWKLMVSLWIGQATVIGKTFNVCLQHFPLVDKHSKTYQIKIKKSMISWLHILIFSGKDQCSLWNDCESFCAIFRRLQTRTKRKTPWHDAKHC